MDKYRDCNRYNQSVEITIVTIIAKIYFMTKTIYLTNCAIINQIQKNY